MRQEFLRAVQPPWRRNRKRTKDESWRQVFLQVAPFFTAMLSVLFTVVPLATIAIVGLLQRSVPESGVLGIGDRYPMFMPPFWLMWVPGLIALAFAVLSIPESGKFPGPFWGIRLDMFAVTAFGLTMTLTASVAYGGPFFLSLIALSAVWLLAITLITIRGTLGVLRLVPRSWR